MQLWKAGGNFTVKLLPHIYPLRHSNGGRKAEEKEELKNLLMRGKFPFDVMVDHELFRYIKNKK